MTQKIKNTIFCGTLKTHFKDFSQRKEQSFSGLKLYEIELNKFQKIVPLLIDFLSPIEIDRANKFHFINDKNRFIICRAILKFLLTEETDLNIKDIVFNITNNKKPYLASHTNLFFNITHSENYALIAIATNPIGIDIEYLNYKFDFNDILPTVFNKFETNKIDTSNDKHLAFYKLWTRKEAIVKAIGTGIDDNFLKIQVLDGHHKIPSGLFGAIKHLNVYSFSCNEDYVGAIAICEENESLSELVFYSVPVTFHELITTKG